MTTLYAAQAAGALATLKRKGAPVTFTQVVNGTYDAVTDTWTGGSTVTVSGYAVEIPPSDAQQRRAGTLILQDARILLFGCPTAGTVPALGSTVSWGGVTLTLRSVESVAPDGTAVISTLTVSR